MKRQNPLIILAALLAILGATAASAMGKRPGAASAPATEMASLKACELKVDGMTCGGCERAVKAVLSKEEGFADAEVSYKKGNALIHYDPAKTTPEKLAEVVTKKAGYKASVKEAKP